MCDSHAKVSQLYSTDDLSFCVSGYHARLHLTKTITHGKKEYSVTSHEKEESYVQFSVSPLLLLHRANYLR